MKKFGSEEIKYDKAIKLNLGETKELTELKYLEKHFNVYREDNTDIELQEKARILDKAVASYEGNIVTGKSIGRTELVVKEEGSGTVIYIPVEVVRSQEEIVPDVKAGENFTVTLKSNRKRLGIW